MSLSIKVVRWADGEQELRRIRTEVFMQEQGVTAADEWDSLDEQATHFLIGPTDGCFVGTARVLAEHQNARDQFHIGRVAVQKPNRGKGVGEQLMREVLTWCNTVNPRAGIYLHAQTDRQAFYERLGFVSHGDGFIDANIMHIKMIYRK